MSGLFLTLSLLFGLSVVGLCIWAHSRISTLSKVCVTLSKDLASVKKDQELALQCSYGMGQRMLRLERRFKTMLEAPQREPVIEQPFSYTQATQMVMQGADVEAIAATCGISHSEAHLMRRLCEQGLAEIPIPAEV